MTTTPFTVEGIRTFHRWTHASLDLLLDHLETISPPAYLAELPGFGFPTLRNQVIHILNSEGFWIHILQRQPYTDPQAAAYPTVADARRLKQEIARITGSYLSALTDQQLNANVELHFPDGDTALRTPALVLHHVLTHAFHHKGQIVAMCRLLNHPAPDTDLNQFV